jgi:hypothetical protein
MQLTSGCMEHIHHDHHNHAHEHGEAFGPAAENLLLQLALRARAGDLRVHDMPDIGEIAKLEEQFDIKNIKARLGDAYPDIGFLGEAAVIVQFAGQAHELPTSHSRYDHSHGADDGCGKTHGPVRRTLETIEQKVLGRIRSRRIKLVAAAAFRGSSLVLCPGDDLAAIGLQLYGAFSGHTGHDEHRHEEHKAILPGRPRIDFAKGTAVISSLPLDVAMPHDNMPDTPAGRIWRERTSDPEPPKAEIVQAQPERKKHVLRKLALFGAAAIVFAGGGFAVAQSGNDAPPQAPAIAPSEALSTVSPPKTVQPQQPQIMHAIHAQAGDSQWELIEDRVEYVLGREGRTPLVNALVHVAAHHNADAVPEPGSVRPGQVLQIPADVVIRDFADALKNPAGHPYLAAHIKTLNEQPRFNTQRTAQTVDIIEQQYVG